jgi:glycosyltransferase involved in cell wall biosynthesis
MYLVGAFGTIAPIKGLGYFIEAIPAILKAQPKTCFPIVGGTSSPQSKVELERIKRMIQDLDISEYVILTGMIPDASRYMADFDVIVVPSIPPGEGFGMVVVESMAAVVPPIVTSYGAFPEIVEDGLSGLIVQPKSSTEIAEAVVKLLDNEAIRKEMGQAARERVERFFSIERVADDIQKFYREL